MSTVAAAPARPRRTSPPARHAVKRAPFAGGIAWIVLIGLLLAGIVAVNVLVLQLNVELDRYGRERAELKADSARLRSALSSASANVRIENDATSKLGLVPADPATTTYVQVAAAVR